MSFISKTLAKSKESDKKKYIVTLKAYTFWDKRRSGYQKFWEYLKERKKAQEEEKLCDGQSCR